MEIRGFKAFNRDMTNRYNQVFEEGCKYNVNGSLKFGIDGCGFHFCGRMEDTLRYYDGMNEDIKIASVIGSGEIVFSDDDYYGYYDMYASSSIFIEHVYTREEIISHFLAGKFFNLQRFLSGYRLMDDEILLFKEKFFQDKSIVDVISYYQENNKVYKKRFNKDIKLNHYGVM